MKSNGKAKIDRDIEFLLLEEIITKAKKGESITREEFHYCIAGLDLEIKDKIDEILCRLTEYQILNPPRVTDTHYLLKRHKYYEVNQKINLLKETIYGVRSMMLKSIDMVLEYPESENINFLLLQKELFDEYCAGFMENLSLYFKENDLDICRNIEERFYLVKDRMLENQLSVVDRK